MKAQALVELIDDEFKLTDDERDMRGKGGKRRGMGVAQWAGRKDCLGHAGHKGVLGEDRGRRRTNVTNLSTIKLLSEGKSDSTSSIK